MKFKIELMMNGRVAYAGTSEDLTLEEAEKRKADLLKKYQRNPLTKRLNLDVRMTPVE